MKRWILVSLTVGVAAVTANAQQTPTPPGHSATPLPSAAFESKHAAGGIVSLGSPDVWWLSDDERIARRAALIEHRPGPHAPHANAAGRPIVSNRESINGAEHPELFLPYELFDELLWGLSTNSSRKENARSLYDTGIRAFGYNVDRFWATLANAAHLYLMQSEPRRHKASTDFVSSRGNWTFVPIGREPCSARIAALEKARQLLGGRDFFDRFLYSVVAPRLHHASATMAPDLDEQLRFMAGGCK
jgi:hypothetical protein